MQMTAEEIKKALRIKWDKYETALLIAAFWAIEKDKSKKQRIIEELSQALRSRAVSMGYEIDDVFRNVNGITMQLAAIAHCFYPDRPALTSSVVFDEMVSLYKYIKPSFDLILEEALRQIPDPASEAKQEESEAGKILKTMSEHYQYGIMIGSPIEMIRFKRYYQEDHNEEITIPDEKIALAIRKVGFEYEDKVYIISDESKKELTRAISDAVEHQYEIIFYEEFYEKNVSWLQEAHILSPEMMKELGKALLPNLYWKKNYFSVKKKNEQELISYEIDRVWGKSTLRTFAEIKERLPYIPLTKIKFVMAANDEFVWDATETYTRKSLFSISDDQIDEVREIMDALCEKNETITFEDLPIESILAENYELSETAMYDLIFAFVGEGYVRNHNAISRATKSLDPFFGIEEYCKGREECSLEEIEEQYRQLTGAVRNASVISIANDLMIRVDEKRFVADDKVQFMIDEIDGILEKTIHANSIGMKEMSSYSLFPFCGYAWNAYLLESYCRRFSKKFKYDCITANSSNAGAIIKKTCDLTYHDLMAEALARAAIDLKKEPALAYLVSKGYMMRRKYARINELLERASSFR